MTHYNPADPASHKQFTEILDLHEMWLRGEYGGERADLRYTHIDMMKLSHRDLRKANLRGAIFWGCDCTATDFTNADMHCTRWKACNMTAAVGVPGHIEQLRQVLEK